MAEKNKFIAEKAIKPTDRALEAYKRYEPLFKALFKLGYETAYRNIEIEKQFRDIQYKFSGRNK